ncbi:ATP-binding protein [Desulfospira joergensenii]|uniref:ATP-binding protein n=1 Tax=Desulfospira joergensenii TaxID=53329 RepID=UPI0003B5BD33|nr:ATP-binding protein [Desulfospira joergensenii]
MTDEMVKQGKISENGWFLKFLEQQVPAWKNREDSEHEQAAIRILVGLLAASYLFMALLASRKPLAEAVPTTITIFLFFVAAAALLVWLVIDPGKNIKRRIIGCCVDTGATSVALYLNGNLAAPLFVIYLWVTFGNGFRFGRSYLFFSMILSITGFCLAMYLSESWQTNSYISLGLLTGMIMLPAYVASLLKRLTKALHQAQIATRAKSNFLATMSHEIRTPLNGIMGILDLLRKTRLDKQQKHYMDLADKSSEWMLQIISDGLDFTKIEADELIVDFSPTDLKHTLKGLSDVYSEIASSRPISFVCRMDENIPAAVECDHFRLIQVLNNLLSNAFKFTRQGEICLSVFCGKQTPGSTVPICFSVSDTGKGVAREDLERIFEPFHQTGSSSLQNQGGTGLGLAIASRIVRLMGGSLEVESTPDKGTRFYFYLNLKPVDPVQSIPIAGKDTCITWKRPPRILLVEDNEINREVAENLLGHFGCEVFACNNGASAVTLAGEDPFDLILMDCQMPGMDGYEATRRIRGMTGPNAQIPIIALTAHITVEDRNRCFTAGMDDYMGKPFRGTDLELMLSRRLPGLVAGYEKQIPNIDVNRGTGALEEIPVRENKGEILHDLRNRLGGISGNAELALIHQHNPKEMQVFLQNILEEVELATQISHSLAETRTGT